MQQQITFIGAGNMARAIIGGLLADGYPAGRILACDVDPVRCDELTARYAVATTADGAAAMTRADVVVLAVKPQQMAGAAAGLAAAMRARRPLVLSIAAGIPLAALAGWLHSSLPIVRVMPNTPALVGSGAAALVANTQVTDSQREQAEAIMRAVGLTVWLDDEAGIDAVTALSGSGPAYLFLLMESMEAAGIELGLDPADARLLTLQTALGAARLALEADVAPAELRREVTSPGGTTEAALKVFEDGGFTDLVRRALSAAAARSRALAAEFGAR